MKRLASYLLAVILLLLVQQLGWARQLQGDTWASAKAKGSADLVVTYVETPGLVYRNDGKLSGVCVDLLADFVAYVKSTHGVDVNVKYAGSGSSFSDMYQQVRTGKNGVLGLGNITIREGRKKEVWFTPAFMNSFAILVSHNSVPTLSAIDQVSTEFAGLKAYAAQGTTNQKRIEQLKSKHFGSLQVTPVASSSAALSSVTSDTKSFTYLDITFFLDAVKRKAPLKRHQVADQDPESFGLIMPLGNDWQPVWHEFFDTQGGYTEGVGYSKILHNHLGSAAVRLLKVTRQ